MYVKKRVHVTDFLLKAFKGLFANSSYFLSLAAWYFIKNRTFSNVRTNYFHAMLFKLKIYTKKYLHIVHHRWGLPLLH